MPPGVDRAIPHDVDLYHLEPALDFGRSRLLSLRRVQWTGAVAVASLLAICVVVLATGSLPPGLIPVAIISVSAFAVAAAPVEALARTARTRR